MLTIFDFDGTIADTFDAALEIYHDIAAQRGYRRIEAADLPALRAMSAGQLIKHLGISKLKVPSLLLLGRARLRNDLASVPLCRGMGEALHELKKRDRTLGILTSNSAENVHLFLETHGLSSVFEFVSSTNKLSGKHKHLKAISRTFSLETSDLLYVGDEIRDVQAAHKAGARAAAVTWGFNSEEALQKEAPHHLIHRPAELLEISP